jgi:hypothetical protein
MLNQMNRPILLICGCRAYEPYLHSAIKRFDSDDWEIIGIIGGASETTYDPTQRILHLATPDTYEALPQKLHAAFTWISTHRPAAPGVFKTDDDMHIDIQQLRLAIPANQSIPYWGITVSKCNANYVNIPRIMARFIDKTLRPIHQSAVYCFGAGYWISSKALPHIVAAKDDYMKSSLEDVCTGYVMNKAGIIPARCQLQHSEVPRVPQKQQ